MKIQTISKMIRCVAIVLLLPFLIGCFDIKQEITLNADGSGKSVVEVYVQTSIPGSDMQTTSDDGTSTARDFISKSTGVEAWKDVQYKRTPDGRIYFKGTAYFKDYSQLNIHNAGFDLSVQQEGNVLTVQSRKDTSKKSTESKPDTAKIEETKKQWQAMKPMMTSMLENLKQQDTIKLPGKLIEVSNFTKISDNTIQLSTTGPKVIQVLDSVMTNDALLQKLSEGKSPEEMGMGEGFNELLFGKPLRAKVQLDPKPLFNYGVEIEQAKVQHAKLIETLEIVTQVKPAETESNGLHFTVSGIEDTRSTQEYRRNLQVQLTIAGELLSRSGEPRSLNILKATDDTGQSLVLEQDKRTPNYTPRMNTQSEIQEKIKLSNPARGSTVIQELSGTIEFADPKKDPKAKLIAKKFMKENGKLLQFLKPYKIEMAILTNRELEALHKQKKDPNDKGLLSKIQEGYTLDQPNQLFVMIDDPDGRFLNFEILDKSGKPLATKIGNYFGSFSTMSLVLNCDTLPAADAQLAVYVQTPKSIVQIPFQLKNIPLP